MSQQQRNKLMLYCAGGCAINIGKQLHQPSGSNNRDPGFAQMASAYIDTSKSNIPLALIDDFYHIPDPTGGTIDGSGKVRNTNYDAIRKAVPEILHLHKPGTVNIVLHSASGGKLSA